MNISNRKVLEYQGLCRLYLDQDISLEDARLGANHLVRILRILKRNVV